MQVKCKQSVRKVKVKCIACATIASDHTASAHESVAGREQVSDTRPDKKNYNFFLKKRVAGQEQVSDTRPETKAE